MGRERESNQGDTVNLKCGVHITLAAEKYGATQSRLKGTVHPKMHIFPLTFAVYQPR